MEDWVKYEKGKWTADNTLVRKKFIKWKREWTRNINRKMGSAKWKIERGKQKEKRNEKKK